MLKVRLLRKASSTGAALFGFIVEGHADFAEYGKDIVCAGISAISQTALYGLEDSLGEGVEKKIRKGYLEVRVDSEFSSREGPKAVLRALELGVSAIEKSYPGTVTVTYEDRVD